MFSKQANKTVPLQMLEDILEDFYRALNYLENHQSKKLLLKNKRKIMLREVKFSALTLVALICIGCSNSVGNVNPGQLNLASGDKLFADNSVFDTKSGKAAQAPVNENKKGPGAEKPKPPLGSVQPSADHEEMAGKPGMMPPPCLGNEAGEKPAKPPVDGEQAGKPGKPCMPPPCMAGKKGKPSTPPVHEEHPEPGENQEEHGEPS